MSFKNALLVLIFLLGFSKTGPINSSSRFDTLSAIFFPILKPGVKDEFLATWKEWFVTEDTIVDEKTPGKMKSMYFFSYIYVLYTS